MGRFYQLLPCTESFHSGTADTMFQNISYLEPTLNPDEQSNQILTRKFVLLPPKWSNSYKIQEAITTLSIDLTTPGNMTISMRFGKCQYETQIRVVEIEKESHVEEEGKTITLEMEEIEDMEEMTTTERLTTPSQGVKEYTRWICWWSAIGMTLLRFY